MALKVAIVGRPNVGKSTLFNRLVGQKLALVDDTPGVTRDRREGDAALGDLRFRVIDTAGLDEADEGSLGARMQEQTTRALADADVALFIVDARDGITPLDRHFAELLRRGAAPVVLVANKAEGRGGGSGAYEAFALGLGEPIAISAEHGDGMAELYAVLAPYADQAAAGAGEAAATERPLQLAVIGRPNVGKSTLVNRLLGEERLLTGPEAGITRDAIATRWNWQGRAVRLIDTAGLRRRPKVEEKLEKLSVADTLRAIRFAEVVVLVIVATPRLNRWLRVVQERHPPPLVKGRRLKLRYMTQANIRPPTFALFAATPAALPDSYRRYLVNQLREDFELPGVPIRIMLRKGENPYAGRE